MVRAYATLLTKEAYLAGVLVLEQGLRAVGSKYPLVVMVTPALPAAARRVLTKRGIPMRDIEGLYPAVARHTLADARFEETWTKLKVFELEEYDRLVLLDADMAVVKNMDDLFDIDLPADEIAAAHACACNPRKIPHYPKDWIPANCAFTALKHPLDKPVTPTSGPRPYTLLNSGTVVLNPSRKLADAIYDFLATTPRISEFKFPDQDLLAAFFHGRWRPLPWYYNALRTLRTVHTNCWRDDIVRCVHYILTGKPWEVPRPKGESEADLLERWWWGYYDAVAKELREKDPEGYNLVARYVSG
ncbi:glycosyltransferase family 8 protein [Schizophyllum commune H4-8]|uniref:Glycosyltransferase family 8 protein n=1 Tax=Schizophyllum commune (strain H4-8 / FGSC 9210) TaxID=578458 RepID=D8PKQ2_SCHCM|nr:glycosyltransferase family 8 protein [Schizophyllum commune H4-8]KAI5897609.1 glycosyltransferase family 8 protein [Schizophyllum commune H4-8]